MIFEWDETKNASNKAKHQVGFELAQGFEWEASVVRRDRRHEYAEPRWIAFGYIGKRLHSLVFTQRAASIRVISLRKANKRERIAYEKNR